MKQWTLPRGHRANAVAHVWTFPLFFNARERIDVLTAKHLDPVFALLTLLPRALEHFKDGEPEEVRLAKSYVFMARGVAEGIIANAIIEAFGWPQFQNCYGPPSELLRRHPIETAETVEDAKRIGIDLCAYRDSTRGEGAMNPWRAILHDYGIIAHCWERRAELQVWTCLPNWPRPGVADWRRQPADPSKEWGHDMHAKPLERFRVITR